MKKKYIAVKETTRALARVVLVESILPIKKADKLELATIGGWQCVVKKGEFLAGQQAIYIEIDSLVPTNNKLFEFLKERTESLKEFNDITYSRIKSIKLRGELSQGLLIPVPDEYRKCKVGTNLTDQLEILKIEEQIANINGFDGFLNKEPKGWFDRLVRWISGPPTASLHKPWPSFLSKSEQPRIQNEGSNYSAVNRDEETFELSVKLDGTSMTVFTYPDPEKESRIGNFGVCSRNNELSMIDVVFTREEAIRRFLARNLLAIGNGLSSFPRTVKHYLGEVTKKQITLRKALKEIFTKKYIWLTGYQTRIVATSEPIVKYTLDNTLLMKLLSYRIKHDVYLTVQGELIGPGISGNYEKVTTHEFHVYQVYINGMQWVAPAKAREICKELGLTYVPVLNPEYRLPESIKECMAIAKGKGAFNKDTVREGVVLKSNSRDYSFKVISPEYLLKNEE